VMTAGYYSTVMDFMGMGDQARARCVQLGGETDDVPTIQENVWLAYAPSPQAAAGEVLGALLHHVKDFRDLHPKRWDHSDAPRDQRETWRDDAATFVDFVVQRFEPRLARGEFARPQPAEVTECRMWVKAGVDFPATWVNQPGDEHDPMAGA